MGLFSKFFSHREKMRQMNVDKRLALGAERTTRTALGGGPAAGIASIGQTIGQVAPAVASILQPGAAGGLTPVQPQNKNFMNDMENNPMLKYALIGIAAYFMFFHKKRR